MRLQTTIIIASALAAGSVAFAAEKASGDDKYEIREIGEPEN
jgi:Spy/CpxP family protein refolding chaperone